MAITNLHRLAAARPLVLASGSPRRRELLLEIGVKFTVIPPTVNEERLPFEPPMEYALRLAKEKALAVSSKSDTEILPIVLGCDTIVILGEDVLGKPADKPEARTTLAKLSGKQHVVCTAAAFAYGGEILESDCDSTIVKFNFVTDEQIAEYIETGEPLDKAGAYGIQGMGGFLVDSIEGDLDTVIGLPRVLLDLMATQILSKAETTFERK